MGTRWLEHFFEPQKIAVIGASERANSMGGAVISNLLQSGFRGEMFAVNVKRYRQVHGVPCFQKIGRLPADVDLAVICTPADTIERILKQLAKQGIHCALILTGGISRGRAEQFHPDKNPLRRIAQEHGMRIMGPGCLGIMVPGYNLNASYSHLAALPGKVAFIGQSGTLASALLDWSKERGIGFSHFMTLGDSVDVSLPDLIDYLSRDRKVKAIMLHLEHIDQPESFVRAVRNASRGKLVLAIKSSRFPASQLITEEVPAGLRHKDMVYETLLLRAGVMRVDSTEELFESVESLSRMKPLRGGRLAIVSNGMGAAILAIDRLMHDGGELAVMSEDSLRKLSFILPEYWSHSNPIDLPLDAKPSVYLQILEVLEDDPGVDAVLVLHSPTQVVSSLQVAQEILLHARASGKNILTSWLGGATVSKARQTFDAAGVPTYDTPDRAIKAFMHMVRHQRNQELMRQTPSSVSSAVLPNKLAAKSILDGAFADGRNYLTAQEIYSLLGLYGFKLLNTHFVSDESGIAEIEGRVGFPAAIKIIHQEYCHPFAYGKNPRDRWRAVATGLRDKDALLQAAKGLREELSNRYPFSRVHGFSVQPVRKGMDATQFSMGITRDEHFGPLILFGGGGATANILADRQIEMPPLNDVLALRLMERTHIYRVLRERSKNLPRDTEALSRMLLALSQMVVDLPHLRGCELNVLLHPKEGAIVLGMAADIAHAHETCIKPYPAELESKVGLRRSGRSVMLRPIRGEDEPSMEEFHRGLSPESLRYRFFTSRRNFKHREFAQFTQIDYEQEMAFVAVPDDAPDTMLGVVRTWTDSDNVQAEFSVIIADDMRGEGLGHMLMAEMIRYCKQRGIKEMVGTVLNDNEPMLKLARHLGFKVTRHVAADIVEITLPLNPVTEEWQKVRLKKLHEQ